MIHKLISTTSASLPSGIPTQNRLFRVPAGPFTGRLVAFYARTPSVLTWARSDPPYTTWTAGTDFITDAADLPFTAMMDDNADVYVAYSQSSTLAIQCVKLVFANGTWVKQTPATVYDSATTANGHPSLLKDLYDRIWVVWTRDDAGTLSLRVKKSTDDGQTFGAGSSDSGTDLSGTVSSCYGQLIARSTYIHCLFTADGTLLKNRRIHIDVAIWDSPDTLYTGSGLGVDFNAAISADETLGVLFTADDALMLREYDGAIWGALQTVISESVHSPALLYVKTAPYALFLQSIGSGQNLLQESHRVSNAFSPPSHALSQLAPFSTVFCMDADAGSPYADLTTESGSESGADVFHPNSGALLSDTDDSVFFGADDRFSILRALLSTAGVGGMVSWSYWNGTEWVSFTPASGTYHFDVAAASVRLFTDGASTPADWQRGIVQGENHYWIRAVVDTPYTTSPVGSQLTAVAETQNLIPLRV